METKKVFHAINEICSGCENCRLVCSIVKTGSFNRKNSNITMIRVDEEGYHEPIVACLAGPCEGTPLCVKYCPTGALVYETPEEIATKKMELMELWKTNGESKVRAPWAMRRQ